MKIERYIPPKSSFLSVEKDLEIIIERILSNERLKRLLFYTTSNALDMPNLTLEQTGDMLNRNIKLIPKLYTDSSVLNYIIISFGTFVPNPNNPEFRNNTIEFDIVCHYDQWKLTDYQLRPYRIAAEIDSMLDKKHLTGIGDLLFYEGTRTVINDKFGGFCIKYITIHGEEDKKKMLNPIDEELFVKEFKEQYGKD